MCPPALALRVSVALVLVAVGFPAGATAKAAVPAVERATKALCGKEVVLLGEADHGDGATVELKAELVRQLVTKCGFNAVYFEAGTYDFLKIGELVRERRPVTDAMLLSAIGGLWNHDREIAPLIKFLVPRVNSGELRIGGIDDQVGSAGAFYSLEQMPADLAAVLPPARRSDCREQMRRRANYDYSDEHPHDAASIASLDECLAEVERRLRSRRTDLLTEDRLQMVAEFRRAIARDFLPFAELVTRRDKGMYENLRWLMNHAGSHRKAIVWTANGHAAKGTGISDEYDTGPNLGSLVHRALGSRAFALGISTASGSYYRGRKEPARPMPNAAPESLEVRALEGTTSEQVYVNASQLGKLGPAPGSFSHHVPRTERWDQLFDCAMILRAERPPVREP